jgi:DNA gyrase subunit B
LEKQQKRNNYFYPDPSILPNNRVFLWYLSARMRELSYLNKGITITFTDKRELDKDEFCFWNFSFWWRSKRIHIRYLDGNREPIIAHVISMDHEKGNSSWGCVNLQYKLYREYFLT